MKIARYVFQQIFTCVFKRADFNYVIFNPQMIELLFDDNKTKIPLQIHTTREVRLRIFPDYYDKNLLLKCILHHILSNLLILMFSIRSDQALETLFKILTNGGNKFYKVFKSMLVGFREDFREDFREEFREEFREDSENLTKLYNHIIEVKEFLYTYLVTYTLNIDYIYIKYRLYPLKYRLYFNGIQRKGKLLSLGSCLG